MNLGRVTDRGDPAPLAARQGDSTCTGALPRPCERRRRDSGRYRRGARRRGPGRRRKALRPAPPSLRAATTRRGRTPGLPPLDVPPSTPRGAAVVLERARRSRRRGRRRREVRPRGRPPPLGGSPVSPPPFRCGDPETRGRGRGLTGAARARKSPGPWWSMSPGGRGGARA